MNAPHEMPVVGVMPIERDLRGSPKDGEELFEETDDSAHDWTFFSKTNASSFCAHLGSGDKTGRYLFSRAEL